MFSIFDFNNEIGNLMMILQKTIHNGGRLVDFDYLVGLYWRILAVKSDLAIGLDLGSG